MAEHNNKHIVQVRCYTFNQTPYIKETFDGFTMQQTSFPYVCAIIDDASTDGEPEIIKRYLEHNFELKDATTRREENDDYMLIYARHKVNKNCYFAVYLLKYNHYSIKKSKLPYFKEWNETKYIAICEGDDVWINTTKLQKQVDFLESHLDYSCCYTKYYTFDQTNNQFVAALGKEYKDLYDMLWNDVSIATCSFICRGKNMLEYEEEINPSCQNWLMGDKPLFLYMGYRGLTKLIPEYMCKYRILQKSASHSSDVDLQLKRARNTIDIYHFFSDRYFPNDGRLKLKIEGGYFYRAYCIYRKNGLEYPESLKNDIKKYNGGYHKLYIVKLLLIAPYIEKILYGLLKYFYLIKSKLAQ